MDKSEYYDSSIAEEDHIIGVSMQEKQQQPPKSKIRFANVTEIKNFERLSEIKNQKLIQNHPTFFSQNDVRAPSDLAFVYSHKEEYFMTGQRKEIAHNIVSKQQKSWEIKLLLTNIHRQSTLKLQLEKMKRNCTFTLQNRDIDGLKPVRFKYTLYTTQTSLLLRVWVELEGVYKVWKEMEVPLIQNRITLQFQEYNNEQTVVKVNDFLFHLLLKMPYCRQSHFWLLHQDAFDIQRIEFKSTAERKHFDDTETNCSKQCQLI